jgi:hypothetical protein
MRPSPARRRGSVVFVAAELSGAHPPPVAQLLSGMPVHCTFWGMQPYAHSQAVHWAALFRQSATQFFKPQLSVCTKHAAHAWENALFVLVSMQDSVH